MKVEKLAIEQALGHILVHNQAGPDGRKILKKGHRLAPADLPTLQALGRDRVYVAVLDDDDVEENDAARCLGELLSGEGLVPSTAVTGRVNLLAGSTGLLKVNLAGLLALNGLPGLTLATLRHNSLIRPKTIIGTIKVIPYGVARTHLAAAEKICEQHRPLVRVAPFVMRRAALIYTGSQAARHKVIDSFTPALQERLAGYGVSLVTGPYVAEEEQAISQALLWALDSGVDMILVAGETSVMDADDITPRAIKAIGGEIEHHGAPVEPGNMLLLAYYRQIPIVGAPGCARSKGYNVVDMVLPRLAAGERLARRDLIEMSHGGLLV